MVSGKRGWFYGWYFKCQSDAQTLAVIPAVHQTGRNRTCSIQIITKKQSWTVSLPGEAFRRRGRTISIGRNRFGERGIRLAVCAPGLKAEGRLKFGPLSPIKYSIMGPFSLIPFLECRHSILSMKHTVQGNVRINGETYYFKRAQGYWEGDRGRSFPREYISEILERTGKPLRAPAKGDMTRTIHENAACRAVYRFRTQGRTLLAFETDRAAFEYEYEI